MSVLIIEEKPPHFTDVEFEYKGIEFKAQICLLDTGKVMISFRVPKNELEQNAFAYPFLSFVVSNTLP